MWCTPTRCTAGTGGRRRRSSAGPTCGTRGRWSFQSRMALGVERWLARHFAAVVIAVSAAVAAPARPGQRGRGHRRGRPESSSGRTGPGGSAQVAGIDDRIPLVGSVARHRHMEGLRRAARRLPGHPGGPARRGAGDRRGRGRRQGGLRRRPASGGLPACPVSTGSGRAATSATCMADLDVFVQVSTEPEPFGLVVVEALASGVPVVAGAAGGPVEILGRTLTTMPAPGRAAGRARRPGRPRGRGPGPPADQAVPSRPAGGPAARCASPATPASRRMFDEVLAGGRRR